MTPRWLDQVQSLARDALPEPVFRYVEEGARDEVTLREATEAWRSIRLAPHVLRDVREVDTSCTLLGSSFRLPVGVAPMTLQRAAHPDGEIAMARAAAAAGVPLVVSSNAGSTFADIAATGVTWWLQVYVAVDRCRDRTAPPPGGSRRRLGRRPHRRHPRAGHPLRRAGRAARLGRSPSRDGSASTPRRASGWTPQTGSRPWTSAPPTSAGWPKPPRCRSRSRACSAPTTPVGAWTPARPRSGSPTTADASSTGSSRPLTASRRCAQRSATTPRCTSTEASAPASTCSIASALGAEAVFVGRPLFHALAAGGDDGVTRALDELASELVESMRLAGCSSLAATSGNRLS